MVSSAAHPGTEYPGTEHLGRVRAQTGPLALEFALDLVMGL